MNLTYRFLMLFSLVSFLGAAGQTDEVTVPGVVLHADGSPAVGATVGGLSLSGYRKGTPEVTTDQKGAFRITLPNFGEWAVSAYDVERGFPDALIALYGGNDLYRNEGYRSVRKVVPGNGVGGIFLKLRFERPDAVIDWDIRSRRTEQRIDKGRFMISRTDDPQIYISSTLPERGILFVIPKHPVTITVSAPGYRDWSSAQIHGAEKGFTLPTGTRNQRTVYLDDVAPASGK